MDFTQAMEFIEMNYVWILVVGIIILMTIIGYFAEKSNNFSKERPEKVKKQKRVKDEKEEVIDEVPVDESAVDFYSEKINPLDDFKMDLPVENNGDVYSEEIESELEDDSFEESFAEPMSEETETVIEEEPIDSKLYSDFGEDTNENSEPFAETIEETIDNSWNQPVEIEPTVEEETMNNWNEPVNTEIEPETIFTSPVEEENNVESLGIELPSIETLDQEIKDVVDEEDVWKF